MKKMEIIIKNYSLILAPAVENEGRTRQIKEDKSEDHIRFYQPFLLLIRGIQIVRKSQGVWLTGFVINSM
jgi:hypothetical protein